MISWESDIIVRVVNVIYDKVQLLHGKAGTTHSSMTLDLVDGEYINSMKLCKGRLTWGLEGVGFVGGMQLIAMSNDWICVENVGRCLPSPLPDVTSSRLR